MLLSSLPVELLVGIFNELEDKELCRLARLCRPLNHAALEVLFQRHSPTLHAGVLALYRHPPYVIPALCGALFLIDRVIHSLQLSFEDPERLVPELKMLTEIVGSLKSLGHISLTLSMDGKHAKDRIDPMAFTVAFQNLVNLAVEKGCRQLWGSGHLPKNAQPLEIGTPGDKPKKQHPWVAATLLPLRGSFSKLRLFGSKAKTDAPASLVVDQVQGPMEVDLPTARDLYEISISSEMFFNPTWVDWTSHICNTAPLTCFTLDMVKFKATEDWDNYSSMLHLTQLKRLSVYGKDVPKVDLNILRLFLQRHSSTLEDLVLRVPTATHTELATTLDTRCFTGCPSAQNQQVTKFDFPKLSTLSLSPESAQWFINTLLTTSSSASNLPLPSLRNVSLLPPMALNPFPGYHTGLTDALTALAKLATLVTSLAPSHGDSTASDGNRQSQMKWFPELVITCGPAQELVPWMKSHCPPDTEPTELGPTPAPSPIIALTSVEHLSLHISYNVTLTNDEFLKTLPHFLRRFSGLKLLALTQMNFDQVKRLGKAGYWERVKKSCPKLEKCQFWSRVELDIVKLTTGIWTELDLPPHMRPILAGVV
ncbi:hypothetical protein BDN72DRAFT_58818 [Pluteus cervinus]|uniref:Uncharacterized protein n=1 Tax=Pluteus cervinus TaxID=181527 RepID=A0ACD3AQB0_9AGAR|nr:hypothetical protein BDN72DRAFT_58818 [Pluteus cervinus]